MGRQTQAGKKRREFQPSLGALLKGDRVLFGLEQNGGCNFLPKEDVGDVLGAE